MLLETRRSAIGQLVSPFPKVFAKVKSAQFPSRFLSNEDLVFSLLFQQATAGEIEVRKPQLEKISRRAEELSKSTDQYDSERIRKQVASMTTLWGNVCRLLSSSIQTSADILRQMEEFSRLHETLSDWLANIESSVSRDLEESFLSIPDDEGDTVFQVCLLDVSSSVTMSVYPSVNEKKKGNPFRKIL